MYDVYFTFCNHCCIWCRYFRFLYWKYRFDVRNTKWRHFEFAEWHFEFYARVTKHIDYDKIHVRNWRMIQLAKFHILSFVFNVGYRYSQRHQYKKITNHTVFEIYKFKCAIRVLTYLQYRFTQEFMNISKNLMMSNYDVIRWKRNIFYASDIFRYTVRSSGKKLDDLRSSV